MRINEIMTREVRTVTLEHSLQDAARLMGIIDAGFLPVEDNDRLVGTITDRDMALRALAEGLGPETPVSEVMSREVKYCFEDEDVEHVARNMGEIQVRRLPVVNRDKRLVGVVSLGDMAIDALSADAAETALSGISQPNARAH
ncbi:inosine-5-monophosphate dehydrogenase [Devosia geojensis]|uniref:Inosine-5-monophosphate dehydrogenase n=1 Tax=Devosia geojensis TaxID=443610 RepID=A0A0F5FVY8_9HYPH|nr:CBS domain-containing protein [Devosia geojensis]KKB12730.1 inosine-5-monophosphate dehydrogenase [Devosia geojensis]